MSQKQAYRALCAQPNNMPLFHQDWWLDAVCGADGWDAAMVQNGNNPGGAWPYATTKKLGVAMLHNPVLTPYLGPHIFIPDSMKPAKRDGFEQDMTAQLMKAMPSVPVWNLALQPGQQQVGVYKQRGFEVTPRQTFIMPLDVPEEELFMRLHEEYRRLIRKAEDITITQEPEMLPTLWEYQKATLDKKDVHMHFSLPQLQRLYDACAAKGFTALWVARKAGAPQAILWHMWDATRAYYLVGSRNPAIKDTAAMRALIWNAIKASKQMGKHSFDFEGSMDPGVELFFRNFGGTRTLYLVLKKNTSFVWRVKGWLR